jgi:ElaB/YqjD/DUF883 family membrane-anchored ribosome-binding protein
MNETDISGSNHSIASDMASAPMLKQASERASRLAQRGLEVLHDSSQSLRDGARNARDSTSSYVQTEPMKSLLIAGAVGAALMGLISLLSRSGRSR